MIRFLINELLSEKQFKEGRRITLIEVSESTGINRMTLSKMINHKNYIKVTDNLDKLCTFFECKIEDLIEYIPDQK
jgi:putative transcriptional regulator